MRDPITSHDLSTAYYITCSQTIAQSYLVYNTPPGQGRQLRFSSIVGREVSGFLYSIEVEYMNPFLFPFNLNLKLSFPMCSFAAGFVS